MQGHILTEGHQLLLEVGAVAFAGHSDAVEVAALVVNHLPHRHPGDQRRMPFGGEGAHHVDVALGLVLEYRHGGFRPDQQIDGLRAEAHVTVQRQLRIHVCRVPLQILFDVALQGSDLQRIARWLRPGMILQGQANNPRRHQQCYTNGQERTALAKAMEVAQQGRGQRQSERDQPHTAQRRQAREGAVELAVTCVEPRETGEEPASESFLQQPQGGKAQGVGQWRLVTPQPACPKPGGQGEEEGQAGEKRQQQQDCQQRRGAAIGVHADVDPPGAGTVEAEAEAPAPAQRLARAQFAQPCIEQREGQQGQRPDVEGGQGQQGGGAGRHGQQVTGPAGAGDPAHVRP